MADRGHIPSSPACGQWETLLADALDGLLRPEDEATFSAHMAVCPACTALFDEARKGREWLGFLSMEPEVPAGLLDRILAQTGPGQIEGYGLIASSSTVLPIPPAWQRPGFVGRVRRFAEPRLLMTAAMAFFSIAMTLNITGVKLSNLRLSDLRPSIMRSYMERQFNMASTPIIRYYDNSRLAYELLKTMRELSQTAGVGEQREGEDNQQKQQNQTPGESNQIPVPGNGGQQTYPPQLPDSLAAGPAFQPDINNSDFLETSLTFQQRSAHSGGSEKETWERGTKWIA